MNIGDYVRTKKGYIGKIKDIYVEDGDMELGQMGYLYIETDNKYSDESECPDEEDIIKSSPNIIDLIEVGDIIRLKNFAGVYRVCDVSNGKIELDYQGELGAIIINNSSDIKSIVTKEQFSSMEYKLGDK